MKRILLTILLASVITLGALPASPAFARTDEGAVQNDSGGGAAASQEDRDSSAVRYIERHEDGSEEELDAPDDATVYSGQDWLYSGWVIVDKSRTLDDRLGIQGNVKLILCDGVTLTVTKGVRVPESSTLTIYGQKNDSGKLVATGNSYNAGIGSNDADDGHETAAGTIIIHGGNIEATGGSDAAGIGGGNESSGGHVRIYGGTVKATGGTWAAGIGSGDEAVRSGSFTMYGGTVTAHGGTDGAGVGGGNEVDGSVVQIYGGTLKATGDRHAAGIGGGDQGDGLSFIMHGGKVTASTGQYGAGIGGGEEGDGGTVVIYAGKVTASGNEGGAGIGGGSEGNGGDVTINGGTVTATGSKWGAGIGGGYKGDSGTVTINDGKVTARCSGHPYRGAGIGSGSDHDQGGTITINGGHVKAYSTNGAGIGGAYEGDGGTIKITGGLVNAKSESGAGIGGGGSFGVGGGGDGGTTTISGGVVIAVSTQKGAGIGGGEDGDGGSVTISGGHVTASGGYFDYDYWQANMSPDYSEFLKNWSLGDPNSAIAGFIMDIIFSGEYGGAGIGGGDDGDGANVKITGGTVIATAGLSTARAIGHGNDNSGNGTLRIYDGAKVTCGSLSGSTVVLDENPVPAGQRESKPHDRPFAMIEPCDHPNGEIENAGESGHRVDCTYCGYAGELVPHQFDESGLLCPQCGYERVLVTFLPGGGSGEMEPAYVEKGGSYTLPASTFTAPEDSSFTGWKGSVNGGEEDVYPAGRSVVLTENLTLTAQWADPYKVWVGETRVTSINKDDVLGDGKVSYDPSTCTLHFDGVESISGLHNSTLVYAEGMDLTLTGSAVLTRSSSFGRCVHVESGSLTIDGDFTMTGAGLNAVNAGRDVILAGGSIKAEAVRFGIRAGRTLYIQNTITRVESDGSKAFNYDEIEVGDALLVTEYTQAEESNSLSLLRKDPIEIKDANHIVLERGVKVTFVLNNGTMNGQTGTVERLIEPGLVEEPDPAPTREGYTFGGWYTDVERTEEHKFKFDSTELLLDQRLYANWTKVWTVEKDWLIDVAEDAPEMVEVYLLKQNKNGTWDEVTSIILNEDVDWEGSFTVSTGAAEIDTKHYRIREKDHYEAMIYDASDDAFFDEQPTAYFQVNGQKVGFIAKYEMNEETGHMTITNATMKIYSVELTWDIDLGDQDRPDEIEIALQKKEGKFSYSTIQVIKVSRENNWSGQFEPVPIGQMDENGQLDPYSYRVREVRPFQEGEEEVQDDPNDEEAHRRYLESADKRIVHDKYDFDKPYIKNLIKIFDPKDLVSADLTLDWLKKQATKVAIPVPTFTAHIYQYTDTFDKEIAEHDTKYHVKYDHNSSTHKMSITDTAVLDINIYKRWLFFEEEDMPESVYLMLMSKIQDDYAEQMGVDQENIYTPVMTVVYGSQINLLTIPGAHLDKKMKDGLTSMFGSVVGTVADTAISKIIEKYTKTGIAIAEVKDQHGYNPNSSWRASFGVKKYGGFGVPMDFAGAELVTGFMEMIVDAVIKAAGIPKVNMPIMYHPILKCWSIKGYCFKLPVIDRDYEQTGNVINFKVDWDGDNDNYIHGVKHWVDGGAKDRPTSVTLHLYVKNEDGQDEELSVSKDGKLKVSGSGDDWEWGVQIPLDEIAVYENPDDPENSKVTYKEIRVEEDVPSGYEATYDGYDVTNKKPGIETIEISGQKTWDDNDDAEGKRPSSITIQLLADGKPKTHKKVTAANGWKWTFKDLPKYKNDGKTEIKYTIKENVVKGYETTIDGYNVTNKWTGETPTITIMVNGNSDTKTYNGSEQSFEGTFTASSSDAGFDASKFSYSGDKTASGTNVGDYEVGPDESSCRYDDSDYVIVWEMGDPVKLTIEPAEITITVTGHTDTVDYTGSEQSVEGYDKSCGSDLYDESKVSFDGSDKAKGTNVGTYPMNIDSSDFSYNDDNVNAQFQVTDGWLKISPAVLKIKVTGHTKTVTYNGSEQNVEGYDLSCDNEAFSTNKVVFNGEASAKGTEASDEKYTMGLQASQFSYSDSNLTAEFLVTDGWLKINPVSDKMTVTVTGHSDTVTYNGSEQSVTGYDLSCDDEAFDKNKVSFSGDDTAKGTDAGTYKMGLSASQFSYSDQNAEVTFVVIDGELKIEPAKIVITVNGHTETKTYNGQEQTAEGYDISCSSDLYDESKVSFSGDAVARGTEALDSKYMMELSADQFSYSDSNVSATFEINDGWLKITPATIRIKVTGNTKTKTYDGQEQTAEGYSLSSDDEAFAESKVTFDGEASAKGTDASDEKYMMGLNAMQFSYNDSNYTATFEVTDGWLKIDPAEITVTITGNKDTKEYNGEEQQVEDYEQSCESELYDESKVVFSGEAVAKGTDVNTYPMKLDASQFAYIDSNVNVTFVINDGELEITKKAVTVTITGNKDTKEYNGEEQQVEGYETEIDDDLYTEDDFSFSGEAVAKGTDAGKYPMGLEESQFTNNNNNFDVSFVINDGELEITKKAVTVTITGNKDTKEYNGEEQQAEGYETEIDDSLYTEDDFSFSGEAVAKGTNVGTYPMNLAESQFTNNNNNFDVSFVINDGELEITKRAVTVTITGNKDTKAYNGEEQQVEGYEKEISDSLYKESDFSFSGEAVAKGTEVGTYPMGLKESQFTNNNDNFDATFNVTDGELKITDADMVIKVTGHKDTKVYNSEEQTVEGYDLSCDSELYDENKVSFSGEAVAKGTNVGTYPMGLEAGQFSYGDESIKVEFVITDGELKITKRAVTVTIAGNKDSKVYNGEEQQVEGYETEISDSLYKESDFTFSGEAAAKGTDVDTYQMGLKESQFTNNNDNFDVTFQVTDGELKITKRPVTVTITGHKDTKIYNGKEQKVEGYETEISDSLYKESDFSFSGEAVAKGTNTGTYPMGLAASQFTNNNDNFDATFEIIDGELKITDADMVIKVTGHKDTKVYNGEEQTVEGYDLSCDSELYDESKVSFSDEDVAKGTNVGKYPMGLSADQFSYGDESIKVEFVITDGELKITKRPVTITITGNKDTKVYNGEEQKVEGYETEISDSLYKESDFAFSGEAAVKGTNVDTYPMGLKESQFSNSNDNFDVIFQVTDGELKITKLPVTVTITGNKDSKVYNGEEQKVEGYKTEVSDSLYKESDFTFSGEAVAKGTNVDTYPMGLKESQFTNKNDNFDVTFTVTDGELKITPVEITVKVTGHKDTKVYNSEEQTVEGYDLSCDSELYDENKVSFSGEDVAKGTNVGTYPMGLEAGQFSYGDESIKVEFVITDGELKITKRAVTVTIAGNKDSKVYNGEEQQVEGYETEISDSLYKESDFTFSGEAAAKGTDVDTYPMGLKESQFTNNNDNFDVTFQVTDGELKITKLPVTVTITGNKDSKVYNGEEQKVEGYKTEVSDSLYKESDFTFSGEAVAKGTNVDTYPMGLKESQFTNKNDNFDVTFTVTDGELKITPVEITVKVTGHTDTVVYNGSEQEVEGYDLECSSEWYDKSKVSFNGEAAAKGTDVNTEGYPMNLAADQFSYSDTNVNATFEITDGWLKITKKPVTVTITGHKDTKVYNGEEQKVEGYETEISEPLYNESDFTFSGEAVAKGTNAGTYPMGLKESQFTNNNDNFDATFTVIDGELKITDADLVIKVTGHKGTKVYNGEEQSVEGYDLSCDSALYDESKVSFIGEAIAKGTNVGTYPMGLSADQFSYGDGSIKVEFVVTDGELKITKKPVTVTITGHKDTKVYNGEEQTVEGYETKINDSLYKESDFSFSGEAVAKGTDTGTYPMGLEESQFTNKNDNFDAAFKVIDGELKITDADLVIKVTGHKDSKVYNGEEQQVEGYDLSCDSELYDESKVSFSGEAIAKGTNVGTHPMGLSADQFSYGDGSIRVEFVVTDGELEITPAAITIKVTGHTDTVMYNGSEQKAEGYDLSCDSKLFDESKVSFNGEAAAKGTDVNTEGYPMNLAADRFSYSDTNVTATFEITDGWLKITKLPVTVTITGRKETKTYNGEEQKAEGYDVSISEALYKESDFMFSGEAAAKGTDVGTYPMGLAESQFTNNNGNFDVTFRVTDGELKINPAAITVTVTGHTKTVAYTGSEQSVEGYDLSCGSKLFDKNKVSFSGEAAARGTDVNTEGYPMNLAAGQFSYDDPNVTVTFAVTDGWLKITPAPLTITVNGNADSKVYNGSRQRFAGTFTATSSDTGFDAARFSYSGNTTASGTNVGDYTTDPEEAFCSYSDNRYTVTWVMGDPVRLTITPAEITIEVTGHTRTVIYNGQEQSVEGYDLSCESTLYDASKVSFNGEAVAKGIDVGTYPMGLAASRFSYSDRNVTAAFAVTDGWLKIDDESMPEILTITVSGNADTRVYNGREQTFNGTFTASSIDEGFDPSKFSYSGNSSASGTNVGVYTTDPLEEFCSYDDDRYTVVWVMGDPVRLTITPVNFTIKVVGYTDVVTYNGEEQSVTGYDLSCNNAFYSEEKISFSGEAVAKGTDADTYPMGLDASQFSYNDPNVAVSFLVIDGWLKITPAAITVKVTGHTKIVTYNGEEQSVTGYDLSCEDPFYDASRVVFRGEAVAKGTDADTYPMGLETSQFSYSDPNVTATFAVTDGWLKIEPAAEPEAITITVVGHTKTVTYNGSEQSVTGYEISCDSELFDPSRVVFAGDAAAKGTAVGTYPMGLAASQFSYNDPDVTATFDVTDGWLKIEPAAITITVAGHTDTEVYTGREQSVTGYEISCGSALFDRSRVSFSGDDTAKGTDVGTYPMGLAASQFTYNDPNVTATFDVTDGWLKITPAAITITVTGHTDTRTYNGSEQSVTGYDLACSSALYDEDKVSFSGDATAKGTAVGAYPMGLAASQFRYNDPNVTAAFDVTDGWLKITPASLTIRVTGHTKTVTWTGEEQSVTGYDLSSDSALYDAGKVVFSGDDTAKGTDAGTYPMGLDAAQFSYNDANVTAAFLVTDGWLKIEPVPEPDELAVTVIGHTDIVIYDGSEQSVTGYELICSDERFDPDKLVFTGDAVAKGTNVDTYPMGLAASQFSYDDPDFRVTFSVIDGWLKIEPAAAAVDIIGHTDTVIYNGREQNVQGYGVGTSSALIDPSRIVFNGDAVAKGTNVDTYPMGLAEDQFSYNDPNVTVVFSVTDGWLKILPVEFTVKVTGYTDTVVYNGSEQSVTGYDLSCNNAFYNEEKVVFNGDATAKGTNVDTYPMGLAENQFSYDDPNAKVSFLVADGWLKITPASLTIEVTGHTAIVTYNGKEQSVTGYEISCGSPLYDANKVVFSGEAVAKGTNAGTYPMGMETAQFSYNDTNVTATFAVTDGWLKIEPATGPDALRIFIIGHTDTVVYSGKEQSVTGYEISCSHELFDLSKVVFSGDDTAKGTAVGTYPMGLDASQFSYNDPNLTATFEVTDGWLKIEPAELAVTVTGHTDIVSYTGYKQSVTGYDLNCDSELFDPYRVSFSGDDTAKGTDVGTYPMGLAEDQFSYTDPNVKATFAVTDGWLKIEPALIVITVDGNADIRVYSGEEQTFEGEFTASCSDAGFDAGKFSYSGKTTASGTGAGVYTTPPEEEFCSYSDPNYQVVWVMGDPVRLTIVPVILRVTIVGLTDIVSYTGFEQSVEGYGVGTSSAFFDPANVSFSGEAVAKGIDVGTYPMGLGEEQFSYSDLNVIVIFRVYDGWLEIVPVPDPATITITVNGNAATKVYNGSEQSFAGMFTAASSDAGFDVSKFGYSGSMAASGTNVGVYTTAPEEAFCSYSDPDYTVIWVMGDPVKLTITPAEITITVTGHTDTVTYTGSEQSVTGYELACGSLLFDAGRVSFSGEAVAKGTDPGTYPMGLAKEQFSYSDPNVTAVFEVTDGWLKIDPVPGPATITITVNGNAATKVYNGSEQSFAGTFTASSSDEGFDVSKFSYSGSMTASGINVGVYATAPEEAFCSYSDPDYTVIWVMGDPVKLTITPAEITITVTGHTDTVVYTGSEQSVTGYDLTCGSALFDAGRVSFSGEAVAKGTAPDTYPMGLLAAQFSYSDPNVTAVFEITDGWLKIEPMPGPVEEFITVSGVKTWVDSDNAAGKRPESITIRLYADGEEIGSRVVTEADGWAWCFEDLPKYAEDGAEIVYTVAEDAVEDYESAVDGYNVTNTYVPKTYLITYDLNGGTYQGEGGFIYEVYPEGTVISIHEAPVREGYIFLYWKGSEYLPGDQYTVLGDHVFVAQWEAVEPVPPKTADDSRFGLWVTLMGSSFLGLCTTAACAGKKNRKRQK